MGAEPLGAGLPLFALPVLADLEAGMNLEITRWVPLRADAVDAVQITAENIAEVAGWSDAIIYSGDRHGHTTPPFQWHICMTTYEGPSVGPGDWVIRLGDGFRGVPAAEFTGGYEPANEED